MTRHYVTDVPTMNPKTTRNAFILAIIVLIILSFARCKKPETFVFPEIKVSSFKGVFVNKDEMCANSVHFGKYLVTNAWEIKGVNLNTIDEVTETDSDVNIIDWIVQDKNTIIVYTDSDRNDFVGIMSFMLRRAEDNLQIETPRLNFVADNIGFAYNTPVWSVLNYLEDVKDEKGQKRYTFAPDFLSDFDQISGDYEPSLYDIIVCNNQYRVITSKPQIVANAFQRKYTFETQWWDCNGQNNEDVVIFTTNFDKGIVENNSNIQKTFTP